MIVVQYLEDAPKTDLWQLVQDIEYEVEPYGKVIVPAGYITDFASTPRLLWSVIPPIGRYNRATVVHDFLYENRVMGYSQLDDKTARAIADKAFLVIANRTNPKGKVLHYIMYLGVRLFGSFYWIKNV